MTTLAAAAALPSADPANHRRQDAAADHWARYTKPLPEGLTRYLETLKRDGIVQFDWSELGLPAAMLSELTTVGNSVCIESQRQLSRLNGGDQGKTYWHRLLGDKEIASDGRDVFARIALSEPLLLLAGHYFGLSPWLMEYNLWLNTVEPSPPHASQLWHRDTEIAGNGYFATSYRSILKGFIYLHDVDITHGPTVYLPGTQAGGWRADFQLDADLIEPRGAIRYFDNTVARSGLATSTVCAEGPKGTVVVFDASGLHKGGKPHLGTRLLYKFEFGDWLWRGFPYPKLHWSFTGEVGRGLTPLQKFTTDARA